MARIAGINIPQNKLVHIGLTYIYGIGDKFSNQICSSLEIPRAKRINELTDDEILKIREYIDQNFKVEGDLRRDYSLSIKRLIDLACYRGSRHRKKDKLIFDGYPRSLSQAKYLDLLLDKSGQKIDHIFFLNVNKDIIIERIEKRKILENRADDDTETILKRYDTYMETTRPVLEFYSKNPNFHEINGTQEIDQITREIEAFINV